MSWPCSSPVSRRQPRLRTAPERQLMQGHAMRIGLDLDNTLICYDQAFLRVGKEERILTASFVGNKATVKRALLDGRPNGYLWDALQILDYCRRIDAAVLFSGATEFLDPCHTPNDPVD